MKKKFTLLFALLISVTGAFAQNTADGAIDITNVINVVPGYSLGGQFDVVLTDLNTDDNTAFQFDIKLPAGLTYTGYVAGELLDGHTVNDGSVGDNTNRFTAANTSGTTNFKKKQGVLITVKFSVAADATLGDCVINVTGAKLTRSGASYTVADFNKNISINRTITLSEEETSDPIAIDNVDVHVKRTLKGGKWNTIVLPFPVSEANVASAFGSDAEIGFYKGHEATKTGNKVTGVKLNFESKTSMDAHTPYIIKVANDIEEFTVQGVSVTTYSNDLTVTYGTGSGRNYHSSDMIGTYTSPKTLDEYMMFISGNTFMFSKGNSKLKAFRAYFDIYDTGDIYDNQNGSGSRSISISFADDSTTSVNHVESSVENAPVYYNLSGQRVATPTKGLYIANGKKGIIK